MTIQGGCAYIVTNKYNTVLYVGVAASVSNRVRQHRDKFYPKSFTARYNVAKLVYYEVFYTIEEAMTASGGWVGFGKMRAEVSKQKSRLSPALSFLNNPDC